METEKRTISFDEFYKLYRPLMGEHPRRIPLKYDGYKLVFSTGDIYIHTEELKPGVVHSKCFSLMTDDFIYCDCWNGIQIVG